MKTQQNLWQRLFLFSLLPLFLAIFGGSSWLWWSRAITPVSTTDAVAKNQLITIGSGTATQAIGSQLEQAGLIRSKLAWGLWARYRNWQEPTGGFKAGTYEVSPTQSMNAIAEQIWDGKVVQSRFTIPEGWSLQQMANYFETEKRWFSAQEFLAAASVIDRKQYPWLPADIPILEGFLYPDTYQIPKGSAKAQSVVNQMLKRFEQTALPVYQQSQNQTKFSLKEWVTLASIVEKEAVVQQERPRIAGVFISRLQKGIKLESDPTVEYAFGIRQTADKPLTFAQVRKAST